MNLHQNWSRDQIPGASLGTGQLMLSLFFFCHSPGRFKMMAARSTRKKAERKGPGWGVNMWVVRGHRAFKQYCKCHWFQDIFFGNLDFFFDEVTGRHQVGPKAQGYIFSKVVSTLLTLVPRKVLQNLPGHNTPSLFVPTLSRSRWWFQTFFVFTPIRGRFPFWLIFFRWVETTR